MPFYAFYLLVGLFVFIELVLRNEPTEEGWWVMPAWLCFTLLFWPWVIHVAIREGVFYE